MSVIKISMYKTLLHTKHCIFFLPFKFIYQRNIPVSLVAEFPQLIQLKITIFYQSVICESIKNKYTQPTKNKDICL